MLDLAWDRKTFWPFYLYARSFHRTIAWLALLLPGNESERGRVLMTSDGEKTLASVKRSTNERLLRHLHISPADRQRIGEEMALRTMPFQRIRTFYSQWRTFLWNQWPVVMITTYLLRDIHHYSTVAFTYLLHILVPMGMAILTASLDFPRSVSGDANINDYTIRLRPSILDRETLVHGTLAHEDVHVLKSLGYLQTDIVTSSAEALFVYEDLKHQPFFRSLRYDSLWEKPPVLSSASAYHQELVNPEIAAGYEAVGGAWQAEFTGNAETRQATRLALEKLNQEHPEDHIGRLGENYSRSYRLGGMAIAFFDWGWEMRHDEGQLGWFFLRQLAAGRPVLEAYDLAMQVLHGQPSEALEPDVKMPETGSKTISTISWHWTQHWIYNPPMFAAVLFQLHPVPIGQFFHLLIFFILTLGLILMASKGEKDRVRQWWRFDLYAFVSAALLLAPSFPGTFTHRLVVAIFLFAVSRVVFWAYNARLSFGRESSSVSAAELQKAA
jgi:hypothetical protein